MIIIYLSVIKDDMNGSFEYCFLLQEQDMEKLKDFIEVQKPHVIAVTAESM